MGVHKIKLVILTLIYIKRIEEEEKSCKLKPTIRKYYSIHTQF